MSRRDAVNRDRPLFTGSSQDDPIFLACLGAVSRVMAFESLQYADAGEHRRPTFLSDQDQSFHCSLPFRASCSASAAQRCTKASAAASIEPNDFSRPAQKC
jgi:hypothetical protein